MSDEKPKLLAFACSQCRVQWGLQYGRDLWTKACGDIGDAGWRMVYRGGYRLCCDKCEKMYPPERTVST